MYRLPREPQVNRHRSNPTMVHNKQTTTHPGCQTAIPAMTSMRRPAPPSLNLDNNNPKKCTPDFAYTSTTSSPKTEFLDSVVPDTLPCEFVAGHGRPVEIPCRESCYIAICTNTTLDLAHCSSAHAYRTSTCPSGGARLQRGDEVRRKRGR